MSGAKRSRRPAAEAQTGPSKRLKSSHVSEESGLDFLVDDDARVGKKLDARLTNGVSHSQASRVDESQAAVAVNGTDSEEDLNDVDEEDETPGTTVNKTGGDVIEISSNDDSTELEEDEEEDEDEDEEEEGEASGQLTRTSKTGHTSTPEARHTAAGAEDADMDDAELADALTFGEQLQARHPEQIEVQKANPHQTLAIAEGGQMLQPPAAGSLGTVLAQALKTNDKDLLESCFALHDFPAIRTTIQRLQSHQAAILLERIAERVHKRPSRAGKLMVWVQWSLVTHGGYLANQPDLTKKLKALARVTRERANGLQPLLHLKGKLDLLSAQLEARRHMQADSRAANADDMDDESGVLFIEGQDTAWSSDEEAGTTKPPSRHQKQQRNKLPQPVDRVSDDESEVDEDLPNGFINGVEEDSSVDGDDDEERNGMIDDEPEESSEDDDSSNEEAESDASSDEEDVSSDGEESEVEAVKQPKPQTLSRKR